MYGNNNLLVFNIISGKNVYCVTTSSIINKMKNKDIIQMVDYICDKYKNIDYI